MNASAREREAALLLHGLPGPARAQVLARLSAGERARMEPLLHELAQLGIPRVPFEGLDAARGHAADPVDQVARLSPWQVSHALRACSAATTAQILRMADWPWKEAVLAGWTSARRGLVTGLLKGEPPARQVGVLLCRKLLDEARGAAPPASPSVLGRLFAWKR